MFDRRLTATVVTAFIALAVAAVDARAAGKIVCWKDASGKVVGCGDRVPPEYYDSATKELDKRGITRKTTEAAEEAERRRAEEEELARKKAEEKRRVADQLRRDRALLATYTSEREIDDRRDRELEQVEAQIKQLDVALKNVVERRADTEVRIEAAKKNENLAEALPALQRDLESNWAEQRRLEQRIAAREKDMQDVRARFEAQKQRYRMLTGTAPATTPAKAN